MRGDFTRDTFDAAKHYSRVLMQQGRVTLDADHNEQTAILLHQLRTMMRDLVGPCAAPVAEPGFRLFIDRRGKRLMIGRGRLYANGILVENESDFAFGPASASSSLKKKKGPPPADAIAEGEGTYFLYLDVWERHVTPLEDDALREKALNGPDTCTRAQVAWQVREIKVESPPKDGKPADPVDDAGLQAQIDALRRKQGELVLKLKASADVKEQDALKAQLARLEQELTGLEKRLGEAAVAGATPSCETMLRKLSRVVPRLMPRVDPGLVSDDVCTVSPESRYRGAGNQLYRVEIHRGSRDTDGSPAAPTFKWSRDDGSVATAWLGGGDAAIRVANPRGFAAGDWVELSGEETDLAGTPGVLVQVTKIDGDMMTLAPGGAALPAVESLSRPKVTLWNQRQAGDIVLEEGAVPVVESEDEDDESGWIALEDGIQVRFTSNGDYRTGDYWLIPARVAGGALEWQRRGPQPPHGVDHHYVPLGFVTRDSDGKVSPDRSCVPLFEPLATDTAKRFDEIDVEEGPAPPAPPASKPAAPASGRARAVQRGTKGTKGKGAARTAGAGGAGAKTGTGAAPSDPAAGDPEGSSAPAASGSSGDDSPPQG